MKSSKKMWDLNVATAAAGIFLSKAPVSQIGKLSGIVSAKIADNE